MQTSVKTNCCEVLRLSSGFRRVSNCSWPGCRAMSYMSKTYVGGTAASARTAWVPGYHGSLMFQHASAGHAPQLGTLARLLHKAQAQKNMVTLLTEWTGVRCMNHRQAKVTSDLLLEHHPVGVGHVQDQFLALHKGVVTVPGLCCGCCCCSTAANHETSTCKAQTLLK